MSVCGLLIDANGRQHLLDDSQSFRVGRDSASSLVLSDSSVSRVHAEIFFQSGTTRIRDLGSSNGTFVNGSRVTDSELHDGENVGIGSVGFTFRSVATGQQQTTIINDQSKVVTTPTPLVVQPSSGIYCQSCGSSNRSLASFCTKCRSSLRQIRHAEVETAYVGPQIQYIATSSANGGLAVVLSFFWCGLGHIYAGKIGKGIMLMLLYPSFLAFGYLLSLGGLISVGSGDSGGALFSLIGFVFLICAAIVWVYGMVNSYNLAKRASVATISRVQQIPF